MTRRPRPADESGMTLIEIMIALVILSVVVVGVLALLATLVRASDLSNRKTEAEAAAITAADYLKAADFDYGGVDDCQAHYSTALGAYAASYPAPGFTQTVTVFRGGSANISGGSEINAPVLPGTKCLDGATAALRLSVNVASDDGTVSRTQDVVVRCDAKAAKAVGGKCV